MSNNNDIQEEFVKKMQTVADRVFSSEDGKILARQMMKSCHLLEDNVGVFDDKVLRYVVAQQDLVNRFITNLVSKDVLLDIMKG